ncbi:hypothetical protein CHISP_2824 [Chitinispirillum alkaliphilum]|nr:hypothetical protein CHISP_2824 [Chitinispirillum alkaliphilum]
MISLGSLIEELLPFLIIVFFVIISIFGNSGKKRKQQQGSEYKESLGTKRGGRLSEQLKGSLEQLFGTVDEDDEEFDIKNISKPKSQVKKVKPAEAKEKSPYYTEKKQFPSHMEAYQRDKSFPSADRAEEKKHFVMKKEDLVNAVVWSEIIQPPLSLRD